MVSVALIWKRLYSRELPIKEQMVPFSLLVLIVLASIGELYDAWMMSDYSGCRFWPTQYSSCYIL